MEVNLSRLCGLTIHRNCCFQISLQTPWVPEHDSQCTLGAEAGPPALQLVMGRGLEDWEGKPQEKHLPPSHRKEHRQKSPTEHGPRQSRDLVHTADANCRTGEKQRQ